MSPVSSDFARALDSLNATISQAERELSKIPLADRAYVVLEVNSNGDPTRYLEFDSTEECLLVRTWDGDDYVYEQDRKLLSFGVSKRLKYAAEIPELFRKAEMEEGQAIADAEKVNAEIQHFLAIRNEERSL